MMERFKKSWLYVAVVAVLGAMAIYFRRQGMGHKAKAAIDVELGKLEVAKEQRARLSEEANVDRAKMEEVDAQIEAAQREIVSKYRSVDDMDSRAIADAYSKLGY